MEKWVVDIEFRYMNTSDKHYENGYTYASKVITLGIFDDFEDACNEGNSILENRFESRFELNKNWNKKERFSRNNTLISNLAYLTTPFAFFAEITRLDFGSVNDAINSAIEGENNYMEYKEKNS